MSVTPEMARIARGATWSVAGTIATQVLSFATTILAARALTPDIFGIVGMAAVVVTGLYALRDLGFAPAIASGRIADDETLWSAHWLLCLLGAAGAALLAVSAPLVARFFDDSQVATVLRVQAVTVLLASAVVVPQALMQRAGRYATIAGLGALNQGLVIAGVAIGIALGAGVWTLVIPGLVAAALMLPVHWLALGRSPARVFALEKLRPLVREGLRVTGSSLCNFITRNADNAIVGRVSGALALGMYSFSYSFLMQPLSVFSHAMVPVLLPAFGRLDDTGRLSDGVVRTVLALLRLGTPFMIGGALTASMFVPLVFGPRWDAAIPLVQIFMVLGALQIVGPVFGSLALALGDSTFVLRFGVWVALTAGVTFTVGALTAGPLGVAIGYLLHTLALVSVMYFVTRHRFHLPLLGLGMGLARVARDLALMVVAVLAADATTRLVSTSAVARLAADVLAGVIAYVAALRFLSREEMRLLLALLPPGLRHVGARLLGLTLLSVDSPVPDEGTSIPMGGKR